MVTRSIHRGTDTILRVLQTKDVTSLQSLLGDMTGDPSDIADVLISLTLKSAASAPPDDSLPAMQAGTQCIAWVQQLVTVLGKQETVHAMQDALLAWLPSLSFAWEQHFNPVEPCFPGSFPPGESFSTMLAQAIQQKDQVQIERILLGLYATGADYRTTQLAVYEACLQQASADPDPLLCAVAGTSLLSDVHWGKSTPALLHWLAPRLMPSNNQAAGWVESVRNYVQNTYGMLDRMRTHLASYKAIDFSTVQHTLTAGMEAGRLCSAISELLEQPLSPPGIASVLIIQASTLFIKQSIKNATALRECMKCLLYAKAVHVICTQMQDIQILPGIFLAAAYLQNMQQLYGANEFLQEAVDTSSAKGGLLASAQLHTCIKALQAYSFSGAKQAAHRYIQFEYDPKHIFAIAALTIMQRGAQSASLALQVVQAAGDMYIHCSPSINLQEKEPLLYAAIHAALWTE